MIYLYRCRNCQKERESSHKDDPVPCSCGGVSRRVFCVNTQKAFAPHFNHSVGAYVSSDQQFTNLLRQRADENTMATGVEHTYARVDPGDTKALGVTEEGLDETRRRQRANGETERKSRVFG